MAKEKPFRISRQGREVMFNLIECIFGLIYYKAHAIHQSFLFRVVQHKEIFAIFEMQLLEIAQISPRLSVCCTKGDSRKLLTN